MDSSNRGERCSPGSPELGGQPSSVLMGLLAGKQAHRAALARLPYEEKVRIVIELQKLAFGMQSAAGRPARKPWDFS